MERKVDRFTKLYPWFSALSGDLLFYIAIGSLFLAVEKGLSTAEIVSLSTISSFVSIAVQFPLLWLIKRIGNTHSMRLSGLFLLFASILITFGPSYVFIATGLVCQNISISLREVAVVALENNLELVGRRDEFVHIRTLSSTIYSTITMVISFVASLMFNAHHYFPMICCILSTASAFVLSLFIADYSDYDKITPQKTDKTSKIGFSRIVWLIIISNSLFFALVTSGQSEEKLLIQEELFKDFNVDNTALILGVILAFSRIVRVVSNLLFEKLYKKLGTKTVNLLAGLMIASFVLSVLGVFIPQIVIKLIVMTSGYVIILFARDPYGICVADILFVNTPKEQHQSLMFIKRFGVRLAIALTGALYSSLLLKFPLVVVIGVMGVLAVVEFFVGLNLYRATSKEKSKE